jgi:thiamine pyrophosphate-dependent acetolactate synthase large subunit-like protein
MKMRKKNPSLKLDRRKFLASAAAVAGASSAVQPVKAATATPEVQQRLPSALPPNERVASGGYGVGWGAPASVGGALANRDVGRFSVSIQSDDDLMYAPGVLWTAARHRIPLKTANALGLSVPDKLLSIADEVIE